MWKSSDPRRSVDKHREVIISNGKLATTALVETKYGWTVDIAHIAMNGRKWLGDMEEWPEGWLWTDLPTKPEQVDQDTCVCCKGELLPQRERTPLCEECSPGFDEDEEGYGCHRHRTQLQEPGGT